MKVLVTGAAGFIGRAVVTRLKGQGHDPIEIDALVPQAHGRDAPVPPGLHVHDVRDAADWADLLDGVDVVCHQAALVGVETVADDLPDYAGHNDLGTAALLAAMTRRGVGRLVLASSMVVYGEGGYACAIHDQQPVGARSQARLQAGDFDHACGECGRPLAWTLVGEDTPMDPRSAYAASKAAQELYARAWARLTGSRVIALRYHNVYGPGMPRDTPYSGVAAIFRSAIEAGRAPRVFEDGGQTRDFVHVDDVARANLSAIDAVGLRSAGELRAYNVCSGRPITIAEVAALLGGTGAVAPQVTGEFRAGDVRHIVADPARARAELGFAAEVRPEQGIADFASAPLR